MGKCLIAGVVLTCAALAAVDCSPLRAASADELVATIKAVDREGKGNAEAHRAVRELSKSKPEALPAILAGFNGANPLAENWLRGAVESIADRAVKQGETFPSDAVEKFILDRKQSPRARRLAYEWLVRVDGSAADRIIPQMIDDNSPEFRREAVARLIAEAEKLQGENKKEQAAETYSRALAGAVDDDQVRKIINPLEKLGRKVDLQRQFGFITKWHLIGPFDNHEGVGFAASYPPEAEFDLNKKYTGKEGEVSWTPISTEHQYGLLDIAKQVKPYKGAVMYFAHEFRASEPRDVELRLGTPNAWAMWVNGKKLLGRQEYHRGMAVDQFRVAASLKPGTNTILLKVCQNEMDYDWAQRFQFQLRVCDRAGVAVLSEDRAKSASIDAKNNRK